MQGVVRLAVALGLCLVVAGCAGLGGQRGMVQEEALSKAGLQCYWAMKLPLSRGEKIVDLYLLDENLYGLTNANRLIAVNAAAGLLKWSFTVAPPGQKVFPPCHAREPVTLSEAPVGMKEILDQRKAAPASPYPGVMINTLSEALLLDRQSGRLIRRIPLNFAANTGGSSDGTYFYVADMKGWTYAVRLYEGIPLWWQLAGRIVTAAPVCFGGRVYSADHDGYVYANMAGDKTNLSWKQHVGGAVRTSPHVDDRGCFVASQDQRVHALDAITGKPLWEPFLFQGPPRQPIQVGSATIFQYADRDAFYAINLTNGQLRWKMPQARLALAAMDGNAYLLDKDNRLLVVDEVLGQVKASLPMPSVTLTVGNVATPAVFVGSPDGRLACIRLASAGYLTQDKLREGRF